MTNGDKQGDREDSWPGMEDDPELRGEMQENPGNTAGLWSSPKPPWGLFPSPCGLVFGAELGAG